VKLLLDEMLSPAIARELRARGHVAEPIAGHPDREALSDPGVLALARAEHRATNAPPPLIKAHNAAHRFHSRPPAPARRLSQRRVRSRLLRAPGAGSSGQAAAYRGSVVA
jgi:hypothetical protein